jgi:predicted nucleic acid-binding protein
MRRFLYDTSIFIYALRGERQYRGPCREIVRKAAVGDLQGEASGDLLQELVHQRARRTGNRLGAAAAARNVTKLPWWHPVEPNDIQRGIELYETHEGLSARDVISPPSPLTAASTRF